MYNSLDKSDSLDYIYICCCGKTEKDIPIIKK